MDERFIRNLGALSEAECAALRSKKVFIAGCGGLGGYLAELLLRVGVGELAAADPDCFEPSNFNRQLLCTQESLGRHKAGAAAARAAALGAGEAFTGHVCRLDESNLPGLLQGCDLVLDALDNVRSRRALKAACDRLGLPYVFGAVSGWSAQAALSLPGDGLLDRIYPPDYEPEGSAVLSFTPALCASMQAALCVRFLCGRGVEAGRLYFADLLHMDFAEVQL